MQPYLKSDQIYQCPSDPIAPAPPQFQNGYADYFYNAGLSWNGKTGAGPTGAFFNEGVNEAKLEFGTLTILAGDYAGGATATTRGTGISTLSNQNADQPGALPLTPYTATNMGGGGQRHLEGINLAFTDGHVKWVKCSDANTCGTIYQMRAPFSESKQYPTFHTSDE